MKVKLHLISKDTGDRVMTTYTTDSFVTFHHINAYERDGHVIVDLSTYPNADIIDSLMVEALKEQRTSKGSVPQFTRIVLPINVVSGTIIIHGITVGIV